MVSRYTREGVYEHIIVYKCDTHIIFITLINYYRYHIVN